MAARSDYELLHGGDAEDFGVFYARHVGLVTAYVGRRVRRPDLIFDFVAETFARALQQRTRYDSARGPAAAWLLMIARNLLIDSVRRGRVADTARVQIGMPSVHLDEEALERIDARARVDLTTVLGTLPGEQREAVMRRVLAEEPYPLIAERIGCSEQVVRQRVSRGLRALRQTIEEGT